MALGRTPRQLAVLQHADIIIVDEISMLHKNYITGLFEALRRERQDADKPLPTIILSGDFR